MVDTRNIGDKQFMNSSIRALIQYLTEHGFDHAISSKILTRPAVKDFHNIVMFLFKQLDPQLQCTGKFEDEVVTIFKHLGYPVQISKANIAAVGSPHAWPSLLAAVMWLIELLAYDEAAAAGAAEQLEAELEDPASYKAFYEYVATSYALFLSGEDDKYAALESQFADSFESKNAAAQQQIDALTETNKALTEEIKSVESRRAYLPELEAKKKQWQRDLSKFELLVEELTTHRDQLTAKAGAREAELEQTTASVAAVQTEIAALRHRIATQELSPEDVRSMVAERERLEEAQRLASEHRQAVQRRVMETETALRDRVQALEDSARAYNSIAEDLKLVPHTAKNAHGKHYALEVNVAAKKGARLVKTDVRRDIQPSLVDLRVKLEGTTNDYRNDLNKEQDEAEELELRRASTMEHKVVAESKHRRAEEAYRREKEALDQASELHSESCPHLSCPLHTHTLVPPLTTLFAHQPYPCPPTPRPPPYTPHAHTKCTHLHNTAKKRQGDGVNGGTPAAPARHGRRGGALHRRSPPHRRTARGPRGPALRPRPRQARPYRRRHGGGVTVREPPGDGAEPPGRAQGLLWPQAAAAAHGRRGRQPGPGLRAAVSGPLTTAWSRRQSPLAAPRLGGQIGREAVFGARGGGRRGGRGAGVAVTAGRGGGRGGAGAGLYGSAKHAPRDAREHHVGPVQLGVQTPSVASEEGD